MTALLLKVSDVCVVNGAKEIHRLTVSLILVVSSPLRVGNEPDSQSSTIYFSFMFRAPGPAPVFSGNFTAFLFSSTICSHIVPCFPDLYRFILSLASAHSVPVKCNYWLLYDDVYADYKSGRVITFPSSSALAKSNRGGRSQTIFRALVEVCGSMDRRVLTLWKQNLLCYVHALQRLYSEWLKIASCRLSNILYDRNQVASLTFRHRFLAVS